MNKETLMSIRLIFKLVLVVIAVVGFDALASRTQAQLDIATHAIDNITSR